MYTLPEPSTATLEGLQSSALVASPPSPEKPLVPLPAMVPILPVLAVTFRMTLLVLSAM